MEQERDESPAAGRPKTPEASIMFEAIGAGFATTIERFAQAQDHENSGEKAAALSILEETSNDYLTWLVTNHPSYYGKFCFQLGSNQAAVAEREENPERKYSLYEKAVWNFSLAKQIQSDAEPSNRYVSYEDCCCLLGDTLVHCAENQKDLKEKRSLFERAIKAYNEALEPDINLQESNPDYYTDIALASAHTRFRIDKNYRNLIDAYNDASEAEGASPLMKAKIFFNMGKYQFQGRLYREKEIEQNMGENFKEALHPDLEQNNPEMYGQALGYYGLFLSRNGSPQDANAYITQAMDAKYSLKDVNPRLYRNMTNGLKEAKEYEALKNGEILKVRYQEDGTKAWEPITNDDMTVTMKVEGYDLQRSIVILRPLELHGQPPWKSLYKAQMKKSEPRNREGTIRRKEGKGNPDVLEFFSFLEKQPGGTAYEGIRSVAFQKSEQGHWLISPKGDEREPLNLAIAASPIANLLNERLKLGDLPPIGTVMKLDKDDEGNARLPLWNPSKKGKGKESAPSLPLGQVSESVAKEGSSESLRSQGKEQEISPPLSSQASESVAEEGWSGRLRSRGQEKEILPLPSSEASGSVSKEGWSARLRSRLPATDEKTQQEAHSALLNKPSKRKADQPLPLTLRGKRSGRSR